MVCNGGQPDKKAPNFANCQIFITARLPSAFRERNAGDHAVAACTLPEILRPTRSPTQGRVIHTQTTHKFVKVHVRSVFEADGNAAYTWSALKKRQRRQLHFVITGWSHPGTELKTTTQYWSYAPSGFEPAKMGPRGFE